MKLHHVALAGVCWLAATAAQAQAPQMGGTAVFTLAQDPSSVNPATTSNPPDRMIGCIVYEGLVNLGSDYKILPLLAKSWSVSPDGLTYTFELNQAEWHDGKPFTSEDVKYSLTEVNTKLSAIFGSAGRAIESIETPAKDKVVIKLKYQFGPFLLSFACPQGGAIMPAHVFQGTDVLKNPATLTQPVGTGGFKLTEWKRGDYIKLAKNPKYYEQGKPYLDEVIGKVITNAGARLQALRAGEVDLIQFFPGSDQATVKADPKLQIAVSDTSPGMTLAFLNVTKKPFDDVRVRRALMMATDREYLFKNAFYGVGAVGKMPFTTDIQWAVNPEVDYDKMYPYDPAKANALLEEAGLKKGADGKRFTMHIAIYANQYPEFQLVAAALKSMYQAVGVELVTDSLEDQLMLQRVFIGRDFDLTLGSFTSYADPALGISRAFVTSGIGKAFSNPAGYSNPKVDELFDKGERSTDLAVRGKFYQEAQKILAEDIPTANIRQYRNIDGASKRLHGLWGKVQGNGLWTEAWLEK